MQDKKVDNYLFFPVLRRETIKIFEYFLGWRVLRPPVTLPHMVFGRLVPRPCRPSPPPYGWSTGFMAVPTDAKHFSDSLRISPEGILRLVYPSALAATWAKTPAPRAIFAPPDGFTSIL